MNDSRWRPDHPITCGDLHRTLNYYCFRPNVRRQSRSARMVEIPDNPPHEGITIGPRAHSGVVVPLAVKPINRTCAAQPQAINPLGRGRDTDFSAPPAQIRTSAFTHTALTLDAWRQSAHRDKDVEHGVGESIGSREDGGDPIAPLRVDCDGSKHSATTSERDT